MEEKKYGAFNLKKKKVLTSEDVDGVLGNLKTAIESIISESTFRNPKQYGQALKNVMNALYSNSDEACVTAADLNSVKSVWGIIRMAQIISDGTVDNGGDSAKLAALIRDSATTLSTAVSQQDLEMMLRKTLDAGVRLEDAVSLCESVSNGAAVSGFADDLMALLQSLTKQLLNNFRVCAAPTEDTPKNSKAAIKLYEKLAKEDGKKLGADKKVKEKKTSSGSGKDDKQELTDADKKTQQNQDIADDKKEEKNKKKKFSLFKRKDKDKDKE